MSDNHETIAQTVSRVVTELQEYYEELRGESPRASAILAVASLEDAIEQLIRTKFPSNISNTLWKTIAGPGFTPLGSLKAKADIAQAFGFYGPKTRAVIECIATVRNKFAHSTTIRSFDHPKVVERCKKLVGNPFFPMTCNDGDSAIHIQWGFLHTVQVLEQRLTELRWYAPELNDEPPEPMP